MPADSVMCVAEGFFGCFQSVLAGEQQRFFVKNGGMEPGLGVGGKILNMLSKRNFQTFPGGKVKATPVNFCAGQCDLTRRARFFLFCEKNIRKLFSANALICKYLRSNKVVS